MNFERSTNDRFSDFFMLKRHWDISNRATEETQIHIDNGDFCSARHLCKSVFHLWLVSLALAPFQAAATDQPNFVVIFTDDQGYQDVGCFGSPDIRIPRLDAMAKQGMKFTSFYAQPVCGPSRAALMTGCYPMRVAERGHTKQVHPILHEDEITVAEVLKTKGYATACFGKWDLAKHSQSGFFMDLFPTRQGFDYFYGTPTSNDGIANLYRNEKLIEPKSNMATLTERYTDEAISFIEKNQKKPFFVYIPHTMPHTRLDASAKFKGKSTRGLYGDVIEEIDFNVGRIVDALNELKLAENTLAELCGVAVPKAYEPDGLSLKPLLEGSDKPWPRDHHVVQFHGGAGGGALPAEPFAHSVVMTERWRLVNMARQALYDIEADPAQRKDISEEHPDVVKRLREAYQPFWDKVSPRMTPVRIDLGNPDQNPTELCSQDWYMQKGNPPWWFGSIRNLPRVTAPWMVNVRQAGRYRFTLRQWPSVAEKPLVAVRAKVAIAGQEKEMDVPSGCKAVRMELSLPAGPTELWTYLVNENGRAGGAYFTDVELVPDDESPFETQVIPLRVATKKTTPSTPGIYRIGDRSAITFNAELDTLKNPGGVRKWTPGKLKLKDGSNLSGIDFPALGIMSWSADSFGDAEKTIWDGAKLSGLTLNFTGHNFGYNDSMKKVNFSGSTISTTGNQAFLFTDLTGADFSGATLNIAGFSGRMTAFRKAVLTGADFSAVTWGLSTDGLTEKTEFFFSGGPGSSSAADKHLAVTFAGANLSRITHPARAAMIKNLGGFDGKTAIGAKYDQALLTKSGWTAAELDTAGWQLVQ